MNRRMFLKALAVGGVLLSAGATGWLSRCGIRRIVRADHGGLYPGPRTPLDLDEARRQGPWAG